MSRLLPLRGDPDGRLVCSECRKTHGDDLARLWLFEFYHDSRGNMVTDPTQMEVRRCGDEIEYREHAPGGRDWKRYPGGTVFCVGCHDSSPTHDYRVFDPCSGEEGAL